MTQPLCVAFVWHMHQPYYRDPTTGEATMPWARLHGLKDYLDMPQILRDYPAVHQTFNLVPSLVEQIEAFEKGDVRDRFWELSLKPASELPEDEKLFLLTNFFMANWDHMIRPHPRYLDLLMKRGMTASPAALRQNLARFSVQDVRDLQVWFNLAWFDPRFQKSEPELVELLRKGTHFTEEDKAALTNAQTRVISKIVPAYREAEAAGQIEVTTSAYYHPILPLLCDTDAARVALPKLPLPKTHFEAPDDARAQLRLAKEAHQKWFGRPPRGTWPPEGSVSPEVVRLFIEEGFEWFATDEAILLKTLGKPRSAEALYQPYAFELEGKGRISVVFRDHNLSDLIGFVYSRMHPEQAAQDLIHHLHRIRDSLKGSPDASHLVSIILDGENAWEYYPQDGIPFLKALYERLQQDSALRAVTVGEYLKEHPPQHTLGDIFPGSWINGNFAIWIGHEEKNRAWELLSEARKTLMETLEHEPGLKEDSKITLAWKELFIAEGSDWNWWYGEDHSSSNDDEFDRLYRKHLENLYRLLGKEPPKALFESIRKRRATPTREPSDWIHPTIDGKDTNYFEWLYAGLLEGTKVGGTMHQSEGVLRRFLYGFDPEMLYLRLDLEWPQDLAASRAPQITVELTDFCRVKIMVTGKNFEAACFRRVNADAPWDAGRPVTRIGWDKILELALPLEETGVTAGGELAVSVVVENEGLVLESFPERGPLTIKIPPADLPPFTWSA